MNNKTILILDLDGVLITTPPWKRDELDSDGYSKFNEDCIKNLNTLLSKAEFEIWLSSTRRTVKTIEEFNSIFKHRNIQNSIVGFLPNEVSHKTRKEEVLSFVEQNEINTFIIIDDDKSLNDLTTDIKQYLVLTELQLGFDKKKLKLAEEIISELA